MRTWGLVLIAWVWIGLMLAPVVGRLLTRRRTEHEKGLAEWDHPQGQEREGESADGEATIFAESKPARAVRSR